MQKHADLVDLVKSFPTNILLQNLASIQKRTSPIKFAHLAENSENGSISNRSTKVQGAGPRGVAGTPPADKRNAQTQALNAIRADAGTQNICAFSLGSSNNGLWFSVLGSAF